MSRRPNTAELAKAEAAEARAQFMDTLGEVRARLAPAQLRREAGGALKQTGTRLGQAALLAARRNPGRIAGLGVALVLLLARNQIIGAARTTAARLNRTRHASPKGAAND